MKKIYKSNLRISRTVAAFSIALCMLMIQPLQATIIPENPVISSKEKNPGKKSVSKTRQNLNNESVKIYPDILKRTMHVVAKENERKEIDFIVFDTKGTLVLNYTMKAGTHEKITGLARGTYIYHVFTGNEETATGTFVIK